MFMQAAAFLIGAAVSFGAFHRSDSLQPLFAMGARSFACGGCVASTPVPDTGGGKTLWDDLLLNLHHGQCSSAGGGSCNPDDDCGYSGQITIYNETEGTLWYTLDGNAWAQIPPGDEGTTIAWAERVDIECKVSGPSFYEIHVNTESGGNGENAGYYTINCSQCKYH